MAVIVVAVASVALAGWFLVFVRLIARDRPHGDPYRYHYSPFERARDAILEFSDALREFTRTMREGTRRARALSAYLKENE